MIPLEGGRSWEEEHERSVWFLEYVERRDKLRRPPAFCSGSLLIYSPIVSLETNMKCSCGVTK